MRFGIGAQRAARTLATFDTGFSRPQAEVVPSCGRPGGGVWRGRARPAGCAPIAIFTKTSKNELFDKIMYQLLVQLAYDALVYANVSFLK